MFSFLRKRVKRQKTASGFFFFPLFLAKPPRKELAWKMDPLSSSGEAIPPLAAWVHRRGCAGELRRRVSEPCLACG